MRRYPHRVRFLIAAQIIDPATSPTRFAPGGICLQRRTIVVRMEAEQWLALRAKDTAAALEIGYFADAVRPTTIVAYSKAPGMSFYQLQRPGCSIW